MTKPVRLAEKYATPTLSFSLFCPLPVARSATTANVILESAKRFPAVCIIPTGLYTCLRLSLFLSHTDIYDFQPVRNQP